MPGSDYRIFLPFTKVTMSDGNKGAKHFCHVLVRRLATLHVWPRPVIVHIQSLLQKECQGALRKRCQTRCKSKKNRSRHIADFPSRHIAALGLPTFIYGSDKSSQNQPLLMKYSKKCSVYAFDVSSFKQLMACCYGKISNSELVVPVNDVWFLFILHHFPMDYFLI